MITLSSDQEKAVELVLTARLGIVTGPPGSGKTTILKTAIEAMPSNVRILLMAPTGKAAKRMQAVTGLPASTIHLGLGARGRSTDDMWAWGFNADSPVPYDVVIVDEASMIDIELADAVFDAVDPDQTRLIFVGDADQLPSVGPGRVFADLIASTWVPTVRLTTIHRAAERTWVYRVAPKVLRGEWEDAKNDRTYKSAMITDPAAAKRTLVDIVASRFPGAGIKDYQVLSPKYSGELGVLALNTALQESQNPREFNLGEPEMEVEFTLKGQQMVLRPRDPVIQQVNDYDHAVFNGETGVVARVTDDEVLIEFDNRIVRYSHAEARSKLRLSYAVTIHKYQGSEVEWAVVVCHSSHGQMWNRQLLYTAITRAREGVVLVGDRAGLRTALSTDEPSRRTCGLRSELAMLKTAILQKD